MLRLCQTTARVLKIVRAPRAEFSTQGSNKPNPEDQKNKQENERDDDFDETEKKQERKPEEENPDEESNFLLWNP